MIVGIGQLGARANGGYISGRYKVGGMTLYVNNGTALWPGFALRLGRPSELTRITLRRTGTGDAVHASPVASSDQAVRRRLATISHNAETRK